MTTPEKHAKHRKNAGTRGIRLCNIFDLKQQDLGVTQGCLSLCLLWYFMYFPYIIYVAFMYSEEVTCSRRGTDFKEHING